MGHIRALYLRVFQKAEEKHVSSFHKHTEAGIYKIFLASRVTQAKQAI